MASKVPSPDAPEPGPQPRVPVRDLAPEQVRAELWPRPAPAFVAMTADERAELGAIVAALARAAIAGGDLRALAARAQGIGFCIEIWRVRGRVFWALREQPEQRRGGGAYIVRPGPRPGDAPEIVLQAPHVYFDRGTGNLAAALFFGEEGRGRARALFTNTAHRRSGMPRATPEAQPGDGAPEAQPGDGPLAAQADHDEPTNGPADVAHNAEHGFQLATERIVRVLDHVVVIQLHGFADRPGQPEVILSSGADHVPAHINALAAALGAIFGRVLRYPDDIDELGGITNVQGRMLKRYRRARFVHVELSGTTRRRLGRTPALLARFADALLSSAL
ncbi:MAG TPA: hypothetical protein VNM90_27655 [Haliangium sp.]|nr:hypothetical protein [Haliangium sp.]